MPGIAPGIVAALCDADVWEAAVSVGATAPLADPGIGIANGFHIFCKKASASCAVSGGTAEASLFDSSLMSVCFRRRTIA